MADYDPDFGGQAVKVTIMHEVETEQDVPMIEAVSGGWPAILSNLKSVLETGRPMTIEMDPPPEMMESVRKTVAEKPWLK